MTFHDQQLISMTFKAWKMKFLNFMTFQVFHDLYEPCKASEFDKKRYPIFRSFPFYAQTTNRESDFHGVLQFLDPGIY